MKAQATFRTLLYTFIIVILAGVFMSCGSKKKIVEKESVKIEKAEVTEVVEKTETVAVKDSTTAQKSESHTITENSDVTLTQADPNKEIILTDSKGNITKIKGANAIISTRKADIKTKDTISIKLSETVKFTTDLVIKKESKESIEKDKTSKDLIVKRGFPWWILIVLGVLYGGVSYFKKTINPISWFT